MRTAAFPKNVFTCVLATAAALVTVACTESAPTAPEATELVPSFSRGQAAQLSRLSSAGWACMNVPGLGVHCFAPGAFASSPTVQVLVFDTDDPTDADAAFLGTELLIRDDLYAGQPCPAEGGEYTLLPPGPFPVAYRACHHYSHDD